MSGINYSQCWEDTRLLLSALKIDSNDHVVSITSGGDNSLALLLFKPKKIFFLDKNPTQNYLMELKLHAPKVLDHEQYLELLGVIKSKKRTEYFNQISKFLSHDARSWFLENTELLEDGIIHSGKFEKYLNGFRKYLLPLVHSKQAVSQFINQSNLQDQISFYQKIWNTWRWKLFFNIATISSLLRKYARQAGSAIVQKSDNTSYFKKLELLIYRNHLKTNFYLRYALLGEYGETLPDYLLEENYNVFNKTDPSVYEFRCEDLLNFLEDTSDNSLTKFNLSDTFEFLTPEITIRVWKEIIRTAKNDAVISYWCNQIEHIPPQELTQNLICNTNLEAELKKQDRLYFYRSFHIYSILK